jgi:4-hydroxy-3-methylbut-2-enyl diphosphate reductase IspH
MIKCQPSERYAEGSALTKSTADVTGEKQYFHGKVAVFGVGSHKAIFYFKVESMAEVCNATKERQDAVKAFDGEAILVLGSSNSSNTRRLCDVARCRSFRAGNIGELKALDLGGIGRLGVTGGASTPESFFGTALEFLKLKYDTIPL